MSISTATQSTSAEAARRSVDEAAAEVEMEAPLHASRSEVKRSVKAHTTSSTNKLHEGRASDGVGSAPAGAPHNTKIGVNDDDACGMDIRQTTEYRAAWDLELWKAIQADRFRKQVEAQRTRATGALTKSIKEAEKNHRQRWAAREAVVAKREDKLKQDEAQLQQRLQRMSEMEKDLRRTRQQLLDAQKRVEEEVRAQVRRANEDISHRSKMLQERVKSAEALAQRADERQRVAQAEYLTLYEQFNAYRTKQLIGGGGGGGDDGSMAMTSTAYMDRMRAQHLEEQRVQLEGMQQRHDGELRVAHQRCRELEEQNQRLTAALARRREQLRAATTQGRSSSPTGQRLEDGDPLHGREHSVHRLAHLTTEIERLKAERENLLCGSAGAVGEDDLIIHRLDERVEVLEEERRHLTSVGGQPGSIDRS